MKGIIFNLLEEIVQRELGEDAWDALLESAEVDGVYTSLGSYPDEEMMRLLRAASSKLGMSTPDILRWFGKRAVPLLARRYPEFFAGHDSTRSFVLTLNDIIHPEVRKVYPGADVPVFDFDSSSNDVLVLGYQSQRKLCTFAEGLIEGAAAEYGEDVRIDQSRCMNRGDTRCVLRLEFTARAGEPRC